jgi:phosphopantothenoylcysteine decarboxylase / phosphopantothenate---cysteine ligase
MARGRLHIVVTAGPTREYIDPVRFLSNESSGRMGFAIAAEGVRRGHKVTLIAGPVHQDTPKGVRRIDVMSARDMLAAVRTAFGKADALIMAAAVADFRPKRKLAGKWRKKDDGREVASLELVRNPDILQTVARRKGSRLVVGFALETGDGLRRARRKLQAKNADFIVLNDDSALNAARASVTILDSEGGVRHLASARKEVLAKSVIGLLDDRPT